jgi:two-component system, NtrC family, response regulator AtoC
MDVEGKQLHIRIPKELFTKLKVKCAYNGIPIQEYVIGLITESMGQKPAEKGSILIIDDEAVVRESLRDSLKDIHNVTIAETGEEALDLVKKQDFDILIVDVRLPGKSGLEVIKEVSELNPYIRSIVITAYPSVELSVQAMKQGAVDFIVKPVHIDDLEKLINENLLKRPLKRKV